MSRPKKSSSKLPPSEVVLNHLDQALRPRKAPIADDQISAANYVEILMEMSIPGQELHSMIERLEKIAGRSHAAERILAPARLQLKQDYKEFVR